MLDSALACHDAVKFLVIFVCSSNPLLHPISMVLSSACHCYFKHVPGQNLLFPYVLLSYFSSRSFFFVENSFSIGFRNFQWNVDGFLLVKIAFPAYYLPHRKNNMLYLQPA